MDGLEATARLRDRVPSPAPSIPYIAQDIVSAFAGVRPLIRSEDHHASQVSRETQIHESPGGLLSITGGKFTTYRHVAEKATDKILRLLPDITAGACSTKVRPLWGGDLKDFEAYVREKTHEHRHHPFLDSNQISHLISTYGTRYTDLLAFAGENKEHYRRLHPACPQIRAEIFYAIHHESALTLADVLRRRTALGLGPLGADPQLLDAALEVMASELGWPDPEIKKQREAYLKEIL